jgi:hypothetical protein
VFARGCGFEVIVVEAIRVNDGKKKRSVQRLRGGSRRLRRNMDVEGEYFAMRDSKMQSLKDAGAAKKTVEDSRAVSLLCCDIAGQWR